jgi:ornithine decarboxylase
MKLTQDIIDISKIYKTPFMLCDLDIIRSNYHRIVNSVSGAEVCYAMKANDSLEVLQALIQEGSSFDIASKGELDTLLSLGVAPEKIIAFNPIKNEEFLKALVKARVDVLAYDSKTEVDKIAEFAPSSKLLLRLEVDNIGSEWPLTKKFGVSIEYGKKLLRYAKEKGLDVVGLTFHVGSQCLNAENWKSALVACEQVWKDAKEIGYDFSLISLGGGMPIEHLKHVPTIEEIGAVINPIIQKRFLSMQPNLRITIEPGRGLVGDSAMMVTSVVGLADRGVEKWVYIDVGVFNGLMETIENFKYDLIVPGNTHEKQKVTIAGPSCDSVDVPFKDYLLSPVSVNDRIYIMNTGAYTLAYGSRFNSFDVPKCYFLNK